jgi:hypothetical protein
MKKPESYNTKKGVQIEGASFSKVIFLLVLVATFSGFLGWFFFGRFAGKDAFGLTEYKSDKTSDGSFTPTPVQDEPKQNAIQEKTEKIIADASLKVVSSPSGAMVFINDEHRGVTPTTIKRLPNSGKLELRIEKKGHKPWIQTISMNGKDLHRELKAGLVSLNECINGTGFIYVVTRPAGATIELDGKRQPGKTPKVINDLCAGVRMQLKLQVLGYKAWRESIVIQKGEIRNLRIDFEK